MSGAFEIKAVGILPFKVSAEYSVLVKRGMSKRPHHNGTFRSNPDSQWINASEIVPGDDIGVPIPKARFISRKVTIDRHADITANNVMVRTNAINTT